MFVGLAVLLKITTEINAFESGVSVNLIMIKILEDKPFLPTPSN